MKNAPAAFFGDGGHFSPPLCKGRWIFGLFTTSRKDGGVVSATGDSVFTELLGSPYTGEPRNALQPRGATLHRGGKVRSENPRRESAAAKGQKNWLALFGASMLYICLTGLFSFFAYSVSFAGKYFCRRVRVAAEKSSLPSPPSSRSQVTWLAMALFPEQSAFIVLRSSAR